MPSYLLYLSRKLMGSSRRIWLILLQFLLLFSLFNVLAYDLWEERQRHRQTMDAIGRNSYILDAAIRDMNTIRGGDWPDSWLPSQIEYLRENFRERLSYFYRDSILAAENGNALDVLYIDKPFYQRLMHVYFDGKKLPYFHDCAVPPHFLFHGEVRETRPDYELNHTDMIRYLTLQESKPFLVLPAPSDTIYQSGQGDLYPIYAGPLTNEERARTTEELTLLNDNINYSFRLLAEMPTEKHQYEAGSAILRLVFLAAAALILFVGYVGSILMLYAMNRRSLQTLRLFGARLLHARAIVLGWNTYLLLPSCIAALPLSYLYIRAQGSGDFFGSFLPFPFLLCMLLVLLGVLPLLRDSWSIHHKFDNGGRS
ncbi:hypothetical protein ACX1C1_08165 [Paenibacillus sp. strain BS8-2]